MIFISNIHGRISEVANIQNSLTKAAHQIGISEVPIFAYDSNGEETSDQDQRIENLIAAVEPNSIFILQTPTQIGLDFENNLINHLRMRKNVKVILLINEITPLVIKFHASLADYVRLYNRADVLIVQTDEVAKRLRYYGINHPEMVVSSLFDYPGMMIDEPPVFHKSIQYAGQPNHLSFAKWESAIPLQIYSDDESIAGAKYIQNTDSLPMKLNQSGGFGLLRMQNEWGYADYQQWMIPLDMSIYLSSNLPVLVQADTAGAKIVEKYRLGYVYHNVKELANLIENTSEDQYRAITKNTLKFGKLIRTGQFTQRAILNAVKQAWLKSTDRDSVSRTECIPPIKVMDVFTTLDYIEENRPSIARFGDGEVDIICGQTRDFQQIDPVLQDHLKTIIERGSTGNLLVCLPDIFTNLSNVTENVQTNWLDHLANRHTFYEHLAQYDNYYGDAEVTRPYMAYLDQLRASSIFIRIKQWWQNKDVLLVEGKYTRFGVGNDLLANAKSVQRILCPAHNAWDKYSEIKSAIQTYGKGKLVLVSLGMTATVLAADLADWGQVIDIGHLDPEYEWMKMGVKERVPFKNKHAAEFNEDSMVEDQLADPKYQGEIVCDLTK